MFVNPCDKVIIFLISICLIKSEIKIGIIHEGFEKRYSNDFRIKNKQMVATISSAKYFKRLVDMTIGTTYKENGRCVSTGFDHIKDLGVNAVEKIQENPGQFIRHDIIDKVLLRDLPSLYGIQDVQELNSLFTMIAYHSGSEFSYESMSKESGVKKDTLRKYIEYLEAAFLIRVVHRTTDTAKRYQRETSFKIYLTNPSLRCALFQPIADGDEEMGDMVETAVFAQWIPRQFANISYANWKVGKKAGEVDIVGIDSGLQKPIWAVEIKWSDLYAERPGELESLLY